MFLREQSLLVNKTFPQNDARVTFYKYYINTLNSTIHLIIFRDTYLFTEKWWDVLLPNYNIEPRLFATIQIDTRVREICYIDQHLVYSFFIFIFHTFEQSFKIICRKCFPEYYFITTKDWKKISNFKKLIESVLPKLNLWNNAVQNFIEIVVKFRNSIHNNGIYK